MPVCPCVCMRVCRFRSRDLAIRDDYAHADATVHRLALSDCALPDGLDIGPCCMRAIAGLFAPMQPRLWQSTRRRCIPVSPDEHFSLDSAAICELVPANMQKEDPM